MNRTKRMQELVYTLNQYRDMYYNKNISPVSDLTYDTLYDELEALEKETGILFSNSPTQTVGYTVESKLQKVEHSHPMLSLDKTKSVEDLKKFAAGKDCVLMPKMDGLTVLLSYQVASGKSVLQQAETRGNGSVGEIITHNARVFDNIPLTLPYNGDLEIEGEAIITYPDFEKINAALPEDKRYKNPRNLASGSVRQLDSEVAAKRHIRFVAWKVPVELGDMKLVSQKLDFIKRLGYEVVPYVTIPGDASDYTVYIEQMKQEAKEQGYPIDGLVMTYNDIDYGISLGITGHHPKHSIAFKFYDEEELTHVRDVEWTMGKTGVLTPTAVFDPVELDGTVVNRASVHNVSIWKELQLGVGDEITVYKANQIIPQVRENLTKSGTCTLPDSCPICGSRVAVLKENDTESLCCTNAECRGKLLGQLSHFVSLNAANIEGLSEKTLERFISLGWLANFSDIYQLFQYGSDMEQLDGFGKKSVEKLLSNIEKSREITLDRFLYALCIPLIGRSASKDIAKECNGDIQTFISMMDAKDNDTFMHLSGFGDEMNRSLKTWWNTNRTFFMELGSEFQFQLMQSVSVASLEGKVFVITGDLVHYKNRDALVSEIEQQGGKVTGSVSKKTTYLINNDIESESSKNKKAKQLSIPIITEFDFLAMLDKEEGEV